MPGLPHLRVGAAFDEGIWNVTSKQTAAMKLDRTRPCTERIDRDRRSLCQAGGLLIAAAALPACGGGQGGGSCGTGAYDTGLKPSSLEMNSAQPFIMTNRAVFVCRDGGGV